MSDIETAVIGGGVIGLAIGAACANAGHDVFVLERNKAFGQETSSRSSEVIHAGIYYPTGSLKARLCVSGKQKLYAYARERGVATQQLGKLIVATSDDELGFLDAIAAQAHANGVDDLRSLFCDDVRALEPELVCLRGLLSPSTGIIDSHGLMAALESDIVNNGGTIVLETAVTEVSLGGDGDFILNIVSAGESSRITARNVIVAAGLGMASLARSLPCASDYVAPRVSFAKGHYFTVSGRVPFRHLVYPVPVPGGLGTHLTLDLQGSARFGPDVEWVDDIDYVFDDPDGLRRRAFESSVRRYWAGLPDGALVPGYTGIRPKIHRQGEAARDFAIHGRSEHGIARMVTLYGIESPGLTASLAIADESLARLSSG